MLNIRPPAGTIPLETTVQHVKTLLDEIYRLSAEIDRRAALEYAACQRAAKRNNDFADFVAEVQRLAQTKYADWLKENSA